MRDTNLQAALRYHVGNLLRERANGDELAAFGLGATAPKTRLASQRARYRELRAEAVEQFRVETRRKEHGEPASGWWPEGDYLTFTNRADAEEWVRVRAAWYDAPDVFEHRIRARLATPWKDA